MGGGYQDSNGRWHNHNNYTAITATGTEKVLSRVYTGIDDQPDHKVDGSLTPIGTGMEITSEPASGDTYRYGETIDITVTLSAPVDVVGYKHLTAAVGTSDDTWRGPRYTSGTGASTLVFSYTVQARDLDTDGISIEDGEVGEGTTERWGGSGTIKVKGTDLIVGSYYTGLSDQSGHKLDGRPYPKTISITSTPAARADTYGRDEVIRASVNFDQNVDASRDVYAVVKKGASRNSQVMDYVLGSGTDTLVFEYEVNINDEDTDGVSIHLPGSLNIKASGTNIAYQSDPGGEIPVLETSRATR